MYPLILRRASQDLSVQRNHGSRVDHAGTHCFELLGRFVSDIDQQRCQVAKPAKSILKSCSSSNLVKLQVELFLHSLALLLSPRERLIRLRQGKSGHVEAYAPGFAQAQDFFATLELLLGQGQPEYEV